MARPALAHRIATALIALACSHGGERAVETPPPAIATAGPRLVLVVVVDQLPSWVLDRYLPLLPAGGALRTGIASGTHHRRVPLPYAGTFTAPGHAAIHTGLPPAFSGIAANETFDTERRAEVSIVADERYPIFGNPGAFAAPEALRAPTVGDVLKAHSGGRGRVVSLSLKDRAAVLSGGKRADLAVWYDPKLPGFTTSRYYATALPGWLETWQRAYPLAALLAPWRPLDRELLVRAAGSDDAPGEADWLGFGRTFPHDPARTSDPFRALRATPALNAALLELAAESARVYALGTDDVPDLLAVSISTLDYVGHIFGPESWEYLDALLRTDRQLAELVARLSQRTSLAVLVTSDHGAAPLPERTRAEGKPAGRIFSEELVREAERAADAALGAGDWIAGYSEPFLYPTSSGQARRSELVPVLERALGALDSVYAVFDARRLIELRKAPEFARTTDALRRAIALSVPDSQAHCVYVVTERGFIVDPDVLPGYGASHGSPWEYDREVPVIAWGAGVPRVPADTPVPHSDIAATIARLLQLRWAPP